MSSAQYISERPDWAGLWINTSNKNPDLSHYKDIIAGEAGRLKWEIMEPQNNNYDFSELKTVLQRAKREGYYYYCELWTGSNTPGWIYNNVPKVQTTENSFPFYLDEDYREYVKNFFKALADEVASWDPDLIERFAFIQAGFGSTGDRQLYKGTPINPEYNISDEEYVNFMKEMTIAITTAFWNHPETKNVVFLWNIDDYDGSQDISAKANEKLYAKWMKENYNCQLRKQQFTIAIGYQSPNEMDQDNEQRANFFGTSGRWGGNPEFIRGEFNDSKWSHTPLANLNKPLHYYWTSISSVDRGLDAWEVKYDFLDTKYDEAFAFSSRYSYYKKADKSPVAFIALRDVLDYSDTVRFPEEKYGLAARNNQSRINGILNEYKSYGAQNDDNNAVVNLSQSDYLLNATGYNDCTWNVIARNYGRFISQIDANETSAGYWRVGVTQVQAYGRFARGFDVAKNKNAMYFDVDDRFFVGNQQEGKNKLKIKIIYYANDGGSWELKYHANDSTMKTALAIDNETGQGWLTKEVFLEDALLNNGGLRGADLVLQNTGNTNCKFHLIELERDVVTAKYDSIKVQGVSLNSCPAGELFKNDIVQLKASVIPSYAGDQTVLWSSSNPLVATVDSNGKVKAISEGYATITATSHDGGFTDVCEINVANQEIPVYGVSIGDCPWSVLQTGDTHQLIANVAPLDATDRSVTWSSSNPDVAAVSENGLVTALSQGSVKIAVATTDGGYTSTCNLGVMGTATNADIYRLKISDVKIFPNPVSDKLFLEFSGKDKYREIIIFDGKGQLIYQGNAGDTKKQIDITLLRTIGLLTVQIKSGEHFSRHKVCVL